MRSSGIKAAIAALLLFGCSIVFADLREDAARVFTLLFEGNTPVADSIAGKLTALDPANPYFAYLHSMTQYEMGDYTGALEQADISLRNLPAVEAGIRDQVLANKTYLDQAVPIVAGMKRVEGKHFIYCYDNPLDSVLAGEVMEVMEGAYSNLGADLGYYPPDKIRLEAYPDRASFITVSTLSEDEVKRTGTIALCKFNRMLFTSPRALVQGYDWKTTICHEYTHFIINRVSRGRLPLWMHEGMARFEETRYAGGKGGELSLVEQDLLYRAVKTNTFVPLSKMHPSMAKLKDAEESGTAFAEVQMAMKLIYEQGGYAKMRSILDICAKNGNLDSALGGLANFEKQLFDSIRRLNITPVEGVTVMQKAFAEDTAQDEAFLFRKYVRLADMLLERHRTQAAIKEMERADETGKRHSPWIINQIGLLMEKNGEPEKARSMYDRSILLFPEYCNGYFNRAMARKERGDTEGAIKDVEAALGLNPFHIPARELYAGLLSGAGRKQEGAKQKRILEFLQAKRS